MLSTFLISKHFLPPVALVGDKTVSEFMGPWNRQCSDATFIDYKREYSASLFGKCNLFFYGWCPLKSHLYLMTF